MSLNVEGAINLDGTMNVADGEATVEDDAALTVKSGAEMTVGKDAVTYNDERWVPKAKLELLRSKQRIGLAVEQTVRLCSPFPGAMTEVLVTALKLLNVSGFLQQWFSDDD